MMDELHQILPRARLYRQLLATDTIAAHEPGANYRTGFLGSERHLQCLWYDEHLRPATFNLENQETLTILDPGTWNLEAGPDFLNATLLLQPGARQIRGDIELHIHPADWHRHGHQSDPAYANVIAHVTWFAGRPSEALPARVLSLSLQQALAALPHIALSDIDLKAYPYAVLPVTPRPCQRQLQAQPDLTHALLLAAGQYRLQLKSTRLALQLAQGRERSQLFYTEVMGALGYKYNQIPFRMVARQTPLAALRMSRQNALARLLGTAGLLPPTMEAPTLESQQFIRQLWDSWWRNSTDIIPIQAPWRRSNQRPQNSPERRLAAAAALFSGMYHILDELDRLKIDELPTWCKEVQKRFSQRCAWPYWQRYLNFTAQPSRQPHALLGQNRIGAILTNVVLPLAIAEKRLPLQELVVLPPEDLSAPMRDTAYHLLGRDHNPALYLQNGLLQQGLLQIQLDFCITTRPACEGCLLHARLSEHLA